MAVHTATIEWVCDNSKFTQNQYSRAHTWRFDGGFVVPASSSPHVVRVPLSNPANVDPEEAFVARATGGHGPMKAMVGSLRLRSVHVHLSLFRRGAASWTRPRTRAASPRGRRRAVVVPAARGGTR